MQALPLRRAVLRTLEALGLLAPGSSLVSALSGGADSVALLDVLADIGHERDLRVIGAHLDHALRQDSADDAAFCAALCRERGVPFETARLDVRARALARGRGIEETARLVRYAFLRTVRRRSGAQAIAVAHTLDDQAETVLMRLLRGAGGQGLSAMRARRGDIVRPLLGCTRSQILAHLASRGLRWREDPSNADPAFLRNRIRREVIPYLEARFNPRLRDALARAASLLADEQDALAPGAEALIERACRFHGQAAATLSLPELRAAPRAVARLALRRALARTGGLEQIGAAHVERILAVGLGARPSGKRLPLPGRREAAFRFDHLVLRRRREPRSFGAIPFPVPGRVSAPGGWAFSAERCGEARSMDPCGTHVELDEAAALVVRTRRPGDRVRVRGRVVSLKRYLGDQRVPFDLRSSLPLLAAGSTVLWLPGLPWDTGGCGPQRVHVSVTRAPQGGSGPSPGVSPRKT